MKKISIITINKHKNSFTSNLCENIKEKIEYRFNNYIKVEIISINDYNIKYCKNCNTCFFTCKCSIENDEIELLQYKIEKSNLVIFASQVYAHNIPAILKNIIDRNAFKLHLLPYIGKLSATIVTANSSGTDYVTSYLNKIFIGWGLKNVSDLQITLSHGSKDDELELKIDEFIDNIYNSILELDNRTILSTTEMDIYYKAMRKIILEREDSDSEKNYWISKNMIKYQSIQEFIDNVGGK